MDNVVLIGSCLALLGVVALLAFVALFTWHFSADQRARRAMRAAPLRRIEEVTDGENVRIVGRVEAEHTVRAPLSDRACVYWRVAVREWRKAGSHGKHRWVTIIDEHGGVDFFVRDADGRALVKTTLVTPVLVKDVNLASGLLKDAPPRLEAFLEERGHVTRGSVFNKSFRYHEGVVQRGERVCVVGVGCWERDHAEQPRAGMGYREAHHPKRLVMKPPADGPLLVSDETGMTYKT